MKITRYPTLEAFQIAHADRWLANEAEEGIFLHLRPRGRSGNTPPDQIQYLAMCANDGTTHLTASVDPDDEILFPNADDNLLHALIDHLVEKNIPLPALYAPRPSSQRFAERYASISGRTFRIVKQLRIYELEVLNQMSLASGRFREARTNERDLLVSFSEASAREGNTQRPKDSGRDIDGRLEKKALFVWETEGEITCMGALKKSSARSMEVGSIYTPPPQRGKGYATAIVHQLSRKILEENKKVCWLSTDAANPASHKVYERVGYREMCRKDNIQFQPS